MYRVTKNSPGCLKSNMFGIDWFSKNTVVPYYKLKTEVRRSLLCGGLLISSQLQCKVVIDNKETQKIALGKLMQLIHDWELESISPYLTAPAGVHRGASEYTQEKF